MKHFTNNGKEYLKKIKENNKYRQGRSEEQMRGNYIGAFISIIGIVVTLIVAAILS
jgi:hypothetical protein|tara:strand:- start:70 stop:237 length:168 start_codon:yes stop_codon:yes gene_type:complete